MVELLSKLDRTIVLSKNNLHAIGQPSFSFVNPLAKLFSF